MCIRDRGTSARKRRGDAAAVGWEQGPQEPVKAFAPPDVRTRSASAGLQEVAGARGQDYPLEPPARGNSCRFTYVARTQHVRKMQDRNLDTNRPRRALVSSEEIADFFNDDFGEIFRALVRKNFQRISGSYREAGCTPGVEKVATSEDKALSLIHI